MLTRDQPAAEDVARRIHGYGKVRPQAEPMQQERREDAANIRYGSDEAGLLSGYVFNPDEPGRDIGSTAACDVIASHDSSASGAFVWLHFNLANKASGRWLSQRLQLPEAFYTILGNRGSTRVEVADDVIVAVINDVTLFGLDASTVSSMALCLGRRMMVTARHTPLRSVSRLRESVVAGETFHSAIELFAHLLRDQADVLTQIVREATTQVDHIEDALLTHDVAATRTQLGAFRRALVRLQRLLAPEPAALFRLLNRPPGWIATPDMTSLRQSAEDLAAAVADCMALVERVRLLQEEVVAIVNERTSQTLFVLTVVTVMALPLTIIPGLFGMNVGGVPFRDSGAGFWSIAVLLAAFTVIGAFRVFGKHRQP